MFLEGAFEPCKLKGNGLNIFSVWYFSLTPIYELLAWEVGLDSLSIFMDELCVVCASDLPVWDAGGSFSCLEDLGNC